jgi:succinoglycan biosynthesis protein ExoL
MKIAYFVHNIDDAAVQKRKALLELGGAVIKLIGFARFERAPAGPLDGVIRLGRTYDGKFILRILSVCLCILWPFGLIREVKRSDAILCRNLEMLVLGHAILILSGRQIPISYESLDIHRKLLGQGIASRLLRRLELFLINRCRVVITSSPAFITQYFSRIQRYSGTVTLVENRLMPDMRGRMLEAEAMSEGWVIGWFGIIRCQKSLLMLQKLVNLVPNLRVVISGRIAYQEFDDFDEILRKYPAITYAGPYTVEDLPRICSTCHFVWAIDYFEEGDNSNWLLPNRLYDSLALGAVPIALGAVETGRWLMAREAGLVVDEPVSALEVQFQTLSKAQYADLRAGARRVPDSDLFHSKQGAEVLVRQLCDG